MAESVILVEEPGGHYRAGIDFTTLLQRVRELRASETPAESTLWELLRNRRLLGLKFRRQHQFGSFILDFYCAEKRVAVELDGLIHDLPEQRQYDAERDAFLHDQEGGIRWPLRIRCSAGQQDREDDG